MAFINNNKSLFPVELIAEKGTVSGNVVAVNDVSTVPHDVGVTLKSKNIASVKIDVATQLVGGLYDETFSLTVTPFHKSVALNLPAGIYTMSFDRTVYIVRECIDGGAWQSSGTAYTEYTFTVADGGFATFFSFALYDGAEIQKWDDTTKITLIGGGFSETTLSVYGKNLFDKDTAQIKSWYFKATASKCQIEAGINGRMLYVPCKPNTTYTMSKTAGKVFILGWITEEPAVGVNAVDWEVGHTGSNLTITTGANATYLVSYFYNAANDTITIEEMIASVQIEVGEKATPYEPYKEPKTYTANADGSVSGVMRECPSMTLLTDNDGATIDFEYIKKAHYKMPASAARLKF